MIKTKAEMFQEANRSAEVMPPAGARAMVVLVLFDDDSLCVHSGSDDRLTEAMVAGAADMYGVGSGAVGTLGEIHDPFASGQTAIA